MLLRRSPSALSHHQSPGWERGHVLACLVSQGHLVLGLPARRRLPSIVQMLRWKQAERFGVDVRAFVCGPSAANVPLGVKQACNGVLCQLQRKGHLSTAGKKTRSLLLSLWPQTILTTAHQQSQDSTTLKFPLTVYSKSILRTLTAWAQQAKSSVPEAAFTCMQQLACVCEQSSSGKRGDVGGPLAEATF